MVEDPLSDQFQALWNETARNNTDIFLRIFKPVPNNLVKNWKEYDVRFLFYRTMMCCANAFLVLQAYLPNVSPGHVATNLSPAQVTAQLNQIRGHVVQGAIEFLMEEEELVSGIFWSTWNPLLPIWV